jgi:type IV secretion system protein VirB9
MKHLFVLSFLLLTKAAEAAELPRPGQLDPRIQTIAYDPDQVVLLNGTLGYQFMLEFAPDERIETVSIGDSLSWQVTPNRRANVLFIKPISSSATNLTVLTALRHYAFELRVEPARPRTPTLYVARMVYPPPAQALPVSEPAVAKEPVATNSAYTVTGSEQVQPARIFDDGVSTYFAWGKDKSLPAIFAMSQDGSESLVNTNVRGNFVVVDEIASGFRLRDGKNVATVVNQAAERGKGRP